MARVPQLSWEIMLDDADWDSDAVFEVPDMTSPDAPLPDRSRRSRWLLTGVLLILVLVSGVPLWQQAQAGLAQAEEDLTETLALEVRAHRASDNLLAEALLDNQADASWRQRLLEEMQRSAGTGSIEREIVRVDLRDDRAMVQIRVTDTLKPLAYREVRFYRWTTGGWLRTQPYVAFWGNQQTLESEFFIFHFRHRDGAAVGEAALALDALYRQMRDTLGLPLSAANNPAAKIVVFVVAGGERVAGAWDGAGMQLWVRSPLLHSLPERVTDGEFLVEFIAFTLRRRLVIEAFDASGLSSRYLPAPEFLRGLRLWLAWDENGLLSNQKAELVRWLYADAPDGPHQLPISHSVICQTLDLWGLNLMRVSMPFYCSGPNPLAPPLFRPPTGLRHLPLAVDVEAARYDGSVDPWTGALLEQQRGRALAMAMVLEYAVETYGRAALPRLLQAIVAGGRWQEVAPDVFGVSTEAFEAGWWAYLAEEYGVDTANFRR